jgi:hypothetical protein
MRGLKISLVALIGAVCFTVIVPETGAQVTVGIGLPSVAIGVAPACPYGYYDLAPYSCAPFGYYGPEWFNGSVFIGAGPWFHGPRNFHGYVNNGYHPDHGYRGPMPNRGDRAEPSRRVDQAHFNGNEQRDGRGHAVEGKR